MGRLRDTGTLVLHFCVSFQFWIIRSSSVALPDTCAVQAASTWADTGLGAAAQLWPIPQKIFDTHSKHNSSQYKCYLSACCDLKREKLWRFPSYINGFPQCFSVSSLSLHLPPLCICRILYNFKADSADFHWRKDLLRETALKVNPFEISTI